MFIFREPDYQSQIIIGWNANKMRTAHCSNTSGTNKYIIEQIMKILAMLIQNPALTISAIETTPDAYTIAFGGVATGNINAQLAAMAIGAAINCGSI